MLGLIPRGGAVMGQNLLNKGGCQLSGRSAFLDDDWDFGKWTLAMGVCEPLQETISR